MLTILIWFAPRQSGEVVTEETHEHYRPGLVEYALLVSLICVIAIVAIAFFAPRPKKSPPNKATPPTTQQATGPLKPATPVVSWKLVFDNLAAPKLVPPTPEQQRTLIGDVSDELNDPQGWSKSGIIFQYAPYNQQPNLTIKAASSPNLPALCGPKAAGCAYLVTPSSCGITVQFDDDSYSAARKTYWMPPEARVINHEVGHCLGFSHHDGSGDLMDSQPTVRASADPSAGMISQVSQRLGYRGFLQPNPQLCAKGATVYRVGYIDPRYEQQDAAQPASSYPNYTLSDRFSNANYLVCSPPPKPKKHFNFGYLASGAIGSGVMLLIWIAARFPAYLKRRKRRARLSAQLA